MGQFVPGIIHKVGYDQEGRAKFLYISDRAHGDVPAVARSHGHGLHGAPSTGAS